MKLGKPQHWCNDNNNHRDGKILSTEIFYQSLRWRLTYKLSVKRPSEEEIFTRMQTKKLTRTKSVNHVCGDVSVNGLQVKCATWLSALWQAQVVEREGLYLT